MSITVRHEIPRIERRCACIVSKDGVALTALISSYFNGPSNYFCVFEFPTLAYSFRGVSDSGDDGYFDRVLGDRIAGQIGNVLARIQPDIIFLVAVSDAGQSYLRARLPEERLSPYFHFES